MSALDTNPTITFPTRELDSQLAGYHWRLKSTLALPRILHLAI